MRSIFDVWKPNKKQNQLPKDETQSIEYAYISGNVDNISAIKHEIELEQIFDSFLGSSEGIKVNKFIVLMDGAPGVGKTTLTRKICIDWAKGKLLTDHQIVILKPLREMRGHTTASLSDILQADDPELKEQVIKHIQKTSGSGVMFIFDGFDELSSEQRSDKSTIVWKIIRGDCLHKCSVLITSRSYASGPLRKIKRVNRHVEVLGFKKKDIECCIMQTVTDEKKAKTLLEMLKERLDIVSLCYIPLNCRIVLYVYQQLGTLPDTLTKLYEVFILYTIKHYEDKLDACLMQGLEIDIEQANDIKKLPSSLQTCLDFLSRVAFNGMMEDKLVFEHAEISEEKGALSLGLLNCIKSYNGLEAHYYQFLHLTIQEFLAARHLALVKNDKELLEFVRKEWYNDRFKMTLIILSGLTQLNFFSSGSIFPLLYIYDEFIFALTPRTRKMGRYEFLQLAHMLYESQQTTDNWLFPCLKTALDMSGYPLTQFDCLVLANFLALTPEDHVWDKINLSNCELTNDCLQILLTKKHAKQDMPVLMLTKLFRMTSNPAVSIDLMTPLLKNESRIETLFIPSNNLSCQSLGSSEKTLKQLSIENLFTNQEVTIKRDAIKICTKICCGVIQKLLQYVSTRHVKTLHVDSPETFEDCSDCHSCGRNAWESLLKQSKYNSMSISKAFFNEHDILSLIAIIRDNTRLHSIELVPKEVIPYNQLLLLKKSIKTNVHFRVRMSNQDKVMLFIFTRKDKFVDIQLKIKSSLYDELDTHPPSLDKYLPSLKSDFQEYQSSEELVSISPILLKDLPNELQGVTITCYSCISKSLLASIGKSKIVTSFTIVGLKTDLLTPLAEDFQHMLSNNQSLKTLTLYYCEMSDKFIHCLEKGLSCNIAVELRIRSFKNKIAHSLDQTLQNILLIRSQNLHTLNLKKIHLCQEDVSKLSIIVSACKKLKILKIELNDHSEAFFRGLYQNQNLKELKIYATKKMSLLLFQTLSSTSITSLELRCTRRDDDKLGDDVSRAFKQLLNENQILTAVRVKCSGLTSEIFNGITFSKKSPLTELSVKMISMQNQHERWTEFFTSVRFSSITTLDISGNDITMPHGGECYKALKRLLTSHKSLTVFSVGGSSYYVEYKNVVSCIAEALSENCSLENLTITRCEINSQEWIQLFKSLHQNTNLSTLNCNGIYASVTIEPLCEMLIQNQGLQYLYIKDDFIVHRSDIQSRFAKAYIRRQDILNFIVENLFVKDKFIKQFEEVDPDADYHISTKEEESQYEIV